MQRHVFLYTDAGASACGVAAWRQALLHTLHFPASHIHTVTAATLAASLHVYPPRFSALLMPGGADLPYLDRLAGDGVRVIREFVMAGGSYLGICAGAYFASRRCVFERNDRELCVVGDRPLAFVPYDAVGAVRSGFEYGSEKGAGMERVRFEWEGMKFETLVYSNGGAAWDVTEDAEKGVVVLGRYVEPVLQRHGISNKKPAAVLRKELGAGCVTLSGLHPELPAVDKWDEEAMEGGRVRVLRLVAQAALTVGKKAACRSRSCPDDR